MGKVERDSECVSERERERQRETEREREMLLWLRCRHLRQLISHMCFYCFMFFPIVHQIVAHKSIIVTQFRSFRNLEQTSSINLVTTSCIYAECSHRYISECLRVNLKTVQRIQKDFHANVDYNKTAAVEKPHSTVFI